MFKALQDQDNTSRLNLEAGEFAEGIKLYKAFTEALDKQDRARTPRLAVKLDSWHNSLKEPQKRDFAALLLLQGIIKADSVLGKVIKTFDARFVEFGSAPAQLAKTQRSEG